ncbi:phage tail protein [Burkholderia cepacia]|uniref:phage tail protein n=1 Tax=Burkholderia cepacia TaxID=292 RepID=UPI002FE07567
MANLKEESKWEEGVYQFETSDPVQGGPDGIDNVPTKQLANRTRYLKDRADAADKRSDALSVDKVARAGDAMKGRLLGRQGEITPNNSNNAGFAFDGDPDSGMFSPADGIVQIGANGVAAIEVRAGSAVALKRSATVDGNLDVSGMVSVNRSGDEGRLGLGKNNGYFYANAKAWGFYSPDSGQVEFTFSDRVLRVDGKPVWHAGNVDPLDRARGGRIDADISTKSLTIDAGVNAFATLYLGDGGKRRWTIYKSDGAAGNLMVSAWSDDGATQLTALSIDRVSRMLRLFGRMIVGNGSDDGTSAIQVTGDVAVTGGTVKIAGGMVWHTGNLTPLDLNLGGTLKGSLWLTPGARIFLSEGTPQNPSLTFDKDGAPDTGLYHITDGAFGVTCNGIVTARFTADKGTIFDRPVQVPTPAAGDRSNNAASTAFVVDAIASASVGQIIFEARTAARAGCLVLNGAELKRADYPALWAYAQGSGALVEEKDWANGNFGSFSNGDGATTFRIPEFRGEGIRCADLGRGADAGRRVGTWQDSQNRSHAHGASAGAVGDHTHGAWTDSQGFHGHNVSQQPHAHGFGLGSNGAYSTSTGRGYGMDNGRANNLGTDAATIAIGIEGSGAHGHNVGIGGAGGHSHPISVAADGGGEARMRNVAVLAMIRAF